MHALANFKNICIIYCSTDFHSLLRPSMWIQQEQSIQSLLNLNLKFSQTRLLVRPYEKLTSVRIAGQQHHWSLSTQNFHSDSYTLRTTRIYAYCRLFGFDAVYSDRYIWNTTLYGAASWILRKVDHKFLEKFKIQCWRRTEKISWTDRVGNEEILHWVKEKRS